MNKPCGYVCSAASDSHKTVYELLSPDLQALVTGAPRGCRLHTVGRLDCDTSGLLLLTTDGQFSHRITDKSDIYGGFDTASGLLNHHNHRITKSYRATLMNPVSPENQKDYTIRAAAGLTLPPEKKYGEQQADPALLHFINDDVCEITVHEGKFHEVRRIFRALGNEVKELERISIGNLKLPADLQTGQWRSMTEEEKVTVVE